MLLSGGKDRESRDREHHAALRGLEEKTQCCCQELGLGNKMFLSGGKDKENHAAVRK